MGEQYQHFSAEERGVIMAMTRDARSVRDIARALGRAPSSVSRERRRNGFRPDDGQAYLGRPRLGYDATRAGERARRLRHRRRGRKLARHSALWARVRGLLELGWSPEQIAGRLKQDHPGQSVLHVSHETIYTAIYAAPKGELRKGLVALLRQHRCLRRPRRRGAERRGRMVNLLSIHLRPPEADERLLPGHWEGDFIKGTRNGSAVGTLVDRKTLFVMLAKMQGASAQDALEGFSAAFNHVGATLRKTLTYDQGKEMALHEELAARTGLKIYFADPHSPWQRGTMENINGLLRQYLPKNQDLSRFTQRDLDQVAWLLNTRPRKSLGFRTPAEVFFEHCFNTQVGLSDSIVALGI